MSSNDGPRAVPDGDLSGVALDVGQQIGAPSHDEVTWTYRPQGGLPGGSAWASAGGEYELSVAEFATPDLARSAYEELVGYEGSWGVDVLGAAIVSRDDDGLLTIHLVTSHEKAHAVMWGAVMGVTIGVLFPPTVLAAGLVGSATGLGVGHIRHVHHREDVAEQLGAAVGPGMTGVVVLAEDPKAVSRAARATSTALGESTIVVADVMKGASRVTTVDVSAEAVADFVAAASE